MNYQKLLQKGLKKTNDWLRPDAPSVDALPIQVARDLVSRNQFSALLHYRDFDDVSNLVYLDDGVEPAVGFILAINPLMVAGVDAEAQFEAVFTSCPADTIVQFAKLVTPQIEGFVNQWAQSRLGTNDNPVLRQLTERRRDFILKTANGPSMLPKAGLHPRMMRYFCSVRVPFKGDPTDKAELRAWEKQVNDLRGTIEGALKSIFIESEVINEESFKFILRELLNPHVEPINRVMTAVAGVPAHLDMVAPNTRVTVEANGSIGFREGQATEPAISVTCITADATPRKLVLPMMAQTLGNPQAWEERITCPYWAYTNIHILDADKSKDTLTAKFGMLTKQTMSESPWFTSMMSFMYERRDMARDLLAETRKGHRLVRAYTGINLYTPPNEASQQSEFVKGLWRNSGFRVSEEKNISLPVFTASLPLQYCPSIDPPNKGIQRASLMSSLNAACMLQIQGDWRGTSPDKGGPLMVSRAGQISCFDLLQTSINFNFVVVAASGSGKSFLTNEIVCDFLSKGGIARLVDVGRSYHRFCEVMGGENLVFSADKPMSLNPFSDISTQDDLNELMPMLKDLLRLMAYPLTPESETPAFQYQLLEKAIQEAFNKHGSNSELRNVHEWLTKYGDEDGRASDLAIQLEPYATGRYSKWFSGPRTVKFNKPLVVIELEELKQDPQLQAVVLQLVMHQVTGEMYLTDRKIPKLLAIDEAWDLMGGMKTGRFIETAFRRMRKYNGIAGVITQSFEDFEKSDAARAAIENAAWQFILYQRPESLAFAVDKKRIVGDEQTVALLKTVKSGDGFSEVYIRGEQGSGLYRFVTDRHSYYTFTSRATDINRINDLIAKGATMAGAIDTLARADYKTMWRS